MATLPTIADATTLPALSAERAETVTLAIRSFLYAIFKHRRLVLGVFLVVFAGSVIAAIVRPRQWLATAKVLVKIGSLAQLGPSEAPSREINPPLNQEVVKTEADIVRSYSVVDEALHRLNIKPEDGMDWAEFVNGIQKGLTVSPTPGTNGMDLNFIGRDPRRSARLVNSIADVYVEHHNAVYGREGVRQFYDRETRRLEKQMKRAEERLRAFMAKNNVVDLDQEMHLLNADVLDQDKELKAHRGKILATQRKLEEVGRQLASVPTDIPFTEDYLSNPTLQTYKNKVAELEIDRIHLLQQFLPDDRHVRDVEEQIGNLRTQMRDERERILNKQTVRHNELHSEIARIHFALQSLLADQKAREMPLAERLEATRTRVGALRDKSFRLANLKQQVEHTRYSYDLYWKKHEEARVTEAMHDQSMVSVSIIDRAVPPIEPLNGVVLPLLLGMVGGLALATAMAVAVEYLSRRLRFEEEVERYLELPVLAVIPDLEMVPDVASS